MGLCKPNPAVFKTGWSDLEKNAVCVLQTRKGTMWRILTISPPRIIATSDVSEADMRIDWDYIQNDVLPNLDADASGDLTQPLLAFITQTVEDMEAQEALDTQEDDDELDDPATLSLLPPGFEPVSRPPDTPSPSSSALPPGFELAQRPTSKPEPAPAPAPSGLPPGFEPAQRPAPKPEPAPSGLPPGFQPAQRPAQKPEPAPKPAPKPAPAPAPAPAPSGLPPGFEPAQRPTQKPAPAPAPAPSGLPPGFEPAQRPVQKPAQKPAAASAAPARKHAVLESLTPEALKEMEKWEETRRSFSHALEAPFAKYRAALEAAHAAFAADLASVLGQSKVPESMHSLIKAKEEAEFGRVVNDSLVGENAPCLAALDTLIQEQNEAVRLRKSVVSIQRAFRWHVWRENCKDMQRREFRREKAAREIGESEASYLSSLRLMAREYGKPLEEEAQKSTAGDKRAIISRKQFAELFINLDEVIAFSEKLLGVINSRMEKFDNRKTCLGDLFLEISEMTEVYSKYITGFDRSAEVLAKLMDNSDFLKWQEDVAHQPVCHSMRLNTLLIMPIQRVPRYSLLLRELLKLTGPSHPDYDNLNKAYECMEKVSAGINEAKRRAEARERVAELMETFSGDFYLRPSAFRLFLAEGPGAVVTSSTKQAYFYLLSDVILVTKSKKATKVLYHVYLFNGTVASMPEDPSSPWPFRFRVTTTNEHSIDLCFDYEKEALKWKELVKDAIVDLPVLLDKAPNEKQAVMAYSLLPLDQSRSSVDLTRSQRPVQQVQEELRASQKPADSSMTSSRGGAKPRAAHARAKKEEEENASVKEIIAACSDIVKIEEEIVSMPINLRTLFPNYYAQLPPDQIARLKPRIQTLAAKLNEVVALNERVGKAMKTQQVFLDLDTLVMDGEKSIMAMKRFIFAAFPKKAGQPPLPKSKDPQLLLRYIFAWYVKLCEAWINVTDVMV